MQIIKKSSETINQTDKNLLLIFKTSNCIMTMLVILLSITFLISFTIGRYGIPFHELLNIFLSKILSLNKTWSDTAEIVLFNVRFPRVLAAMIIGSGLSLSGATYQGLFKNPMVSPDLLGASAGAGFGAAIAILLSFNSIEIQISAFLFGIGAVMLTYFISTIIGRNNNAILVLVLTGMVVSTLFSSFISMIKYVADPYSKLPAITFWLMGGLSSISSKDVLILAIITLLGALPLYLIRWKLNVLSFGEEEANALGVDTFKIRILVIFSSTLMTAAAVSISGIIGWVGLIIPHFARLVVGPNYKVLIPASMLIGSIYLLIVDDIARSLFSMELPIGILTSLLGAPFFIFMLIRGKKGWI
jgi:ABC-type Fe3+-siderophore transport system, permease component